MPQEAGSPPPARPPARSQMGTWLVILAAVYFLALQWWMSWAVWQREGNTPPEPDDSYSYITGITLIARYGTPLPPLPGIPREQAIDLGVDHLTYNLALGLASRLTGVAPETVYHASFYVGKATLLGALLFFLARSRLRREEQAATLAVLAAYAGDPRHTVSTG